MLRWKLYKGCLEVIILVLSLVQYFFSEENKTIKVFFDCKKPCDMDFIKENITFVDIVREYYYADLYVSIDYEYLSSGGRSYIISFEPHEDSKLSKKEISFTTNVNDSLQLIREKLIHKIKLGLIYYLFDKPIIENIDIKYERKEKEVKKEDKWNGWIFKLSLYTNMNGNQNYKNLSISNIITASKTTKKDELYFSYYHYSQKNKYKISNGYYSSETKNSVFSSNYIYSFSKHLGGGIFLGCGSSTYGNYDFNLRFCPAVEYSFFPYDESLKTKLRLRNYLCGYYYDYSEETIYNKMREFLVKHTVSLIFEVKRKWGDIDSSLYYEYYANKPSKHEFGINSFLSIKVGKGFSFNINGNYSIGDISVNIVKRGLSLEEILLRAKELENNYSFTISFGISYSFGSIYSKEINYAFN